ncbi:sugar isomerase [bacterium]|nr:sugar isomerase [bacterium]
MSLNNLDKFFTNNVEDFSANYLNYLKVLIDKVNTNHIAQVVNRILDARENDSQIFFLGNGGSASTASHYANDISIGSNTLNKPFKAISLTDNQAIITAIANDYGYDQIFVRQLKVLANEGDLIVCITASGNSENIVKAINYANNNKIHTIAITGFDGGKCKKLANQNIHIDTEIGEYGPVEDLHIILAGLIGSYLVRHVK